MQRRLKYRDEKCNHFVSVISKMSKKCFLCAKIFLENKNFGGKRTINKNWKLLEV